MIASLNFLLSPLRYTLYSAYVVATMQSIRWPMLVHNQRTLFLILAALNTCACSSMTRYCNISSSDRSNGLDSAAEINIPRTVQTSLIFFRRSYYYLSFCSQKSCYCNTWSYQDDYQLPACVQFMSEENFFPGKYTKSCMEANLSLCHR